ncbi:ester cyclase [Sinomicrobium weinanense]|uniref:Ester cyclase n=1 Tax=Sinomicrobium weinanense TaxID=2842200 RepID=A0A926Q2J4_9FLAO|nr:ester cyclase [Sinomicrobium weinanense]MBC9794725.1 ester cyclase [Sinomicrobium weinanense]MBU3124984.1 ester cyclase [Sinomicrobium weinanense]
MKSFSKLSVGVLILLHTVNLAAQQHENSRMYNPQNPEKMPITQIQKNKETIYKLYIDCLNTGNLDILDQIISEDYTTDYKGKKVQGPSGYAETVKGVLQGFPDIKFTIEGMIAENDMISVQWTFEGTHNGSFFGYPASGKKVINRAVAVFRLEDGKIVQNRVYPDRLGILQQIGVIPDLQAPVSERPNTKHN